MARIGVMAASDFPDDAFKLADDTILWPAKKDRKLIFGKDADGNAAADASTADGKLQTLKTHCNTLIDKALDNEQWKQLFMEIGEAFPTSKCYVLDQTDVLHTTSTLADRRYIANVGVTTWNREGDENTAARIKSRLLDVSIDINQSPVENAWLAAVQKYKAMESVAEQTKFEGRQTKFEGRQLGFITYAQTGENIVVYIMVEEPKSI